MIIDNYSGRIKYRNRIYSRIRNSPYWATTSPQKMLHWAILEDHLNIKIPKGMHVHHIDFNHTH